MANLPPTSDSGNDPGVGPGREYPGIPRWVKVSGIIVIVLILLVVIMLFTGVGGDHGPSRHIPAGDVVETPSGDAVETPSGDPGGDTPPIENGVQQP